jgi:hypothetical protein
MMQTWKERGVTFAPVHRISLGAEEPTNAVLSFVMLYLE